LPTLPPMERRTWDSEDKFDFENMVLGGRRGTC